MVELDIHSLLMNFSFVLKITELQNVNVSLIYLVFCQFYYFKLNQNVRCPLPSSTHAFRHCSCVPRSQLERTTHACVGGYLKGGRVKLGQRMKFLHSFLKKMHLAKKSHEYSTDFFERCFCLYNIVIFTLFLFWGR